MSMRRPNNTVRIVTVIASLRSLSLATLAVAAALQVQAQNPPQSRSTWSPELEPAFELYYAGEYAETRQMCQLLSSETTDAAVQRDATLLEAMATMRMPGRENRNDGRTRLTRAAQDDPALMERPECALAYGIASLELYDTSTALHHLNVAVQAFAEQKRLDREGEALVWLARAWAKHSEWEVAVPGVSVRRPNDRADADRMRREHIEELRARAAALPGGAAVAAQIEFALAEYLLENSDDGTEGLALLEKLSENRVTPAAAAEALMLLGRRHEEAGRWNDAAAIYARVKSANDPALSREANERLKEIVGPRLELNVPPQISPGQPTPITLKCRNVNSVDIEVRRVDVQGWLEKRQGRLAEAALPADGAMIALQEFTTTVQEKHDWWTTDSLDEPPVFQAPPGAAVVIARAKTDDGRGLLGKSLVMAGDLRATAFIGRRRAALWVTASSPGVAVDEARAWFWMRGSFVPTRLELADGVAEFDLPAEARLLRDKHWVCLIRAGEHTAICAGVLPETVDGRQPAVVLLAAPQAPAIGEFLRIVGFLPDRTDRDLRGANGRRIEVTLTDAQDVACGEAVAELNASGVFSSDIPVAPAMAGKNLRIATRHGGRVLEQINDVAAIAPQTVEQPPLTVQCRTTPWLTSSDATVNVNIEAISSWPGTSAGLTGTVWLQAARLPGPDTAQSAEFSKIITRQLDFDADGGAALNQPLAEFGLSAGPLAIGVWAEARGCDQRAASGFGQGLIGPDQLRLWLNCDDEGRHVGGLLRVELGWFDPCQLAVDQQPEVIIRHAGDDLAELELSPLAGGLCESFWRPSAAGEYEIEATLRTPSGDTFSTSRMVTIEDTRAGGAGESAPLRFTAVCEAGSEHPQIRVHLTGRRSEPLLALIADDEPLALREIPDIDGASEFSIPISEPLRNARLMLIANDADGPMVLGEMGITREPLTKANSHLAITSGPPAAGKTLPVSVTGRAIDNDPDSLTTITLRLTDLEAAAGGPWAVNSGLALSRETSGLLCASSSRGAGLSVNGAPPTLRLTGPRRLSADLASAWFDLPTLWIGCKTLSTVPLHFDVPMPARPGRYRLIAAAVSPDGRFESTSLDIDTRRQLQVALDAPGRMHVGDRTAAGLLVSNRSSETAVVRLELTAGGRISVAAPRALHHRDWFERRDDDDGGVLTLPPQSSATLLADIEAVSSGDEQITLRATAKTDVFSTAVDCSIGDDEAANGTAATPSQIDLKRTVLALSEPRESGMNAEGMFDLKLWRQAQIEPDESVQLGQLLLVREEFSLSEPLRDISWLQLLPANARTHAGVWEGLRVMGTPGARDVQALRASVSWLGPGFTHVNEYVIVADRPGSCVFPPPSMTAGDDRPDIRVAPSAARLDVGDR